MIRFACFISLLLASESWAFVPSTSLVSNVHRTASTETYASNNDVEESSNDRQLDRRSVLLSGVLASTAVSSWSSPFVPFAFADSEMIGSDPSKPVAVIGAGGKCGKLCCEIMAKNKMYARAVTRSGRNVLDAPSDYVSYASGDVTDISSIKEAVKGCSGVIFAASASGKKKGGDPEHVDFLGTYNTAKACLEGQVPKLVGTMIYFFVHSYLSSML